MTKLTTLLLLAAFTLWAADFWIAKPYKDWNEKDIQKMLNDSPWAHKVTVELGVGPGGPGGGRGGPGDPGGPDPRFGNVETGGTGGARGENGGPAKGGKGASGPQGGSGQEPDTLTQAALVTLFWQSALPVKQALLKAKYGFEVTTSADAKTILEREEKFYVLAVRGLPSMLARGGGDLKKTLMEQSTLTVKGKEPLRPADVQVNVAPTGVEAYYLFPRTTVFSVDDKEVEFASKVTRVTIKYKFRLKDMMYGNKLEM
jgi:hypothetical protein